ncbi:helix-turn-helix transcriptional regulator [Vibrio splendidus]
MGNSRETKHRDNGNTLVSGKTLINRRTLLTMIPLSDRTIYNMEKRGEFPRRIVLTSRNVAWNLAEVENWIEERKQSDTQTIRPGIPLVLRSR